MSVATLYMFFLLGKFEGTEPKRALLEYEIESCSAAWRCRRDMRGQDDPTEI
jgi:hypothetical protein